MILDSYFISGHPLMKNKKCKERVQKWMRHAIDLNLEKEKMVAHKPVATNGFILNLIDVLLLLCKPFTGNFEKYGNFLTKINCFYFMSGVLRKQEKFDLNCAGEKLENVKKFIKGEDQNGLEFSGVTMNPISQGSSLMDEEMDGSSGLQPPNFISECFFLVHILITFMNKKLE